jgi:hypothetical protein
LNGSLLAALEAKIAEIQSTLAEAAAAGYKWNEAQTESVVIDPLLAVLGYGPLEAHKQGHDAVTKDVPDYTLLPNDPHKWFLEVKKLDLPLKDGEAHQAVSYAVAQGAEWAVLTNGRAWYFYNAHYPKPLAEKRVFQIGDLFTEPGAVPMLARLSRDSMMGKGLTQAWVASRVAEIVRRQLQTPNSAARKALRKAASDELQTPVADSLIGSVLDEVAFPKIGAAHPDATSAPLDNPPVPPSILTPKDKPTPKPLPPAVHADGLHTLQDLASHPELVTGKKPSLLELFGEAPQPVKSWSVLVQKTLVAVAAHHGLPSLPFVGSQQGEKYFLNASPVRADGKPMITVVQIPVNGTVIYADMNRSAINTVQGLLLLLKAVGAPPEAVKLKVGQPDTE